jgi:ABC-type lipoprotein export system ATPase subunit
VEGEPAPQHAVVGHRRHILQLFRRIADQGGTTVLIATHDLAVDAFADEVHHQEDGRILE